MLPRWITSKRACGRASLAGLAAIGVLVQPATVLAPVPLALLAAMITFSGTDVGSRTGKELQPALRVAAVAGHLPAARPRPKPDRTGEHHGGSS